MSSDKTTATELSVAFGILGVKNPEIRPLNIQSLFSGTLNQETYERYTLEFNRKHKLYQRFIKCGSDLREMIFPNVEVINWTGAQQQASTKMISEDLYIPLYNMPISVKNESNVVANPSPHNLFRSLPKGEVVVSKGTDWFIEKDEDGLQAIYDYAKNLYPGSDKLPSRIDEFYETIPRYERDGFQDFIKEFSGSRKTNFYNLYIRMCNRVAERSAEEFNRHLTQLPANAKAAVYENFVKQFFRIDHLPYILTGIDHKYDFGVRIPDLTSWKREWLILSVLAEARQGGQSMVTIAMTIQNKRTHDVFNMGFRVEIRWSHGKFCGNPESKLYKEFSWRDVPFFQCLF